MGRYWLFFVIVAVGLALSWGLVGRKTETTLLERPVVYLDVEAGCQPRLRPCAAWGRDRALILGPAGEGLQARQTGLDDRDFAAVEALLLDADDKEVKRIRHAPSDTDWRLDDIPADARTVRYRVVGNRVTTVADFPLPQ